VTGSLVVLQLLVTFVVMGSWVTIIAYATDNRGRDLGAFLVGFPSTSAMSFFFTGWIVSPSVAVEATTDFPLFMSLTGSFLVVFAFASRKSFSKGLGWALVFWVVTSLLIVLSGFKDFGLSMVGCTVVSAITYYLFRWRLQLPFVKDVTKVFNRGHLVIRFVLGGGIVATAVGMGLAGIPVLSGMFSAFPALFSSTLLAVNMRHEKEYSRGMTMGMMVSAILMIIPYSVAVRYLYPVYGIGYGTIIALLIPIAIGAVYLKYAKPYLVPSFLTS